MLNVVVEVEGVVVEVAEGVAVGVVGVVKVADAVDLKVPDQATPNKNTHKDPPTP